MSYYWSLCLLLFKGALGWRLWLAVFPVLPVPDAKCPLRKLHEHLVSFTAPPFICFGAAMQGHLVRTAMIRTSHYSCTHYLHRCPLSILTCLYYHLWWYVFYGIVKLKAV